MKPGRNNEGRIEGGINTDAQKGDESIVPVEIWYRRVCSYEKYRES